MVFSLSEMKSDFASGGYVLGYPSPFAWWQVIQVFLYTASPVAFPGVVGALAVSVCVADPPHEYIAITPATTIAAKCTFFIICICWQNK